MVKPGIRRERNSSTGGQNDVVGGGGGRYKGVRMRKWGRWVAEVRQPNSRKRIWLGSYNTPQEAALAYDAAVFCLRGPSVLLNFPETPPEIPSAGDLSPSQIQEAACRHSHSFPATAEVSPVEAEISEGMLKFPAEDGEASYGLGMAEVGVHKGDDGLTCETHYQPPSLWTF
ncbi:Ethylene-responsive transcription factor [Morus notabilis]|uniref:Dehydration responsive element binding transcription factor n=1 Tax=Morus notabilis TaxID=981085 RepID=W6FG96_9ROSA|nr:ethylene-responsive transcription factor ERF011 [Morus notabilis]AHJ25976.1 dehydration responsive element binding transcription factor [Morus notabilis]EXB76738.1 Ethylene-responsive transcription factor [Morus notabilis]